MALTRSGWLPNRSIGEQAFVDGIEHPGSIRAQVLLGQQASRAPASHHPPELVLAPDGALFFFFYYRRGGRQEGKRPSFIQSGARRKVSHLIESFPKQKGTEGKNLFFGFFFANFRFFLWLCVIN